MRFPITVLHNIFTGIMNVKKVLLYWAEVLLISVEQKCKLMDKFSMFYLNYLFRKVDTRFLLCKIKNKVNLTSNFLLQVVSLTGRALFRLFVQCCIETSIRLD